MATDMLKGANRDLLEAMLDDTRELSEHALAQLFTRAAANNKLTLLKVSVWLADYPPVDVNRALALLALYAKFFPEVVEYNIEDIAVYGGVVAVSAVQHYTAGGKRFIKRFEREDIYRGLPDLQAPSPGALLRRITQLPELRRMKVA